MEAFSSQSALRQNRIISSNAGEKAEQMLFDKSRLNGHTLFCFVVLNRWLESYIEKVIAEIGQNHNGDMVLAKELIYAAKEAGANVKIPVVRCQKIVRKKK